MRSLRKLAAETKTLPELIALLESDQRLKDASDDDLAFWRESVSRLVWDRDAEDLLLLRGDLQRGAEWRIVCTDLARGNSYSYSWLTDGKGSHRFAPSFSVGPLADWEPTDAKIEGTLPLPGTLSACVQIWSPDEPVWKAAFAFGSSERDVLRAGIRWGLQNNQRLLSLAAEVRFPDFDTYKIDSEDNLEQVIQLLTSHFENLAAGDRRSVEFSYESNRKTKRRGIVLSPVLPFPE